MIALFVYSSQLRYLKKVITKDDRDYAKECDSFMLFDRKLVRILMVCLASSYLLVFFTFATFPLISNQEYFMLLPVQMPWTKFFTHPGYEINYIFSMMYATFGFFLMIGKILLFYNKDYEFIK